MQFPGGLLSIFSEQNMRLIQIYLFHLRLQKKRQYKIRFSNHYVLEFRVQQASCIRLHMILLEPRGDDQ